MLLQRVVQPFFVVVGDRAGRAVLVSVWVVVVFQDAVGVVVAGVMCLDTRRRLTYLGDVVPILASW